jgi:hypothetical protein
MTHTLALLTLCSSSVCFGATPQPSARTIDLRNPATEIIFYDSCRIVRRTLNPPGRFSFLLISGAESSPTDLFALECYDSYSQHYVSLPVNLSWPGSVGIHAELPFVYPMLSNNFTVKKLHGRTFGDLIGTYKGVGMSVSALGGPFYSRLSNTRNKITLRQMKIDMGVGVTLTNAQAQVTFRADIPEHFNNIVFFNNKYLEENDTPVNYTHYFPSDVRRFPEQTPSTIPNRYFLTRRLPPFFDTVNLNQLDENEDPDCTICLESLKETLISHEEVVKINCGSDHMFCRECINGWCKEKNTCPNCRGQIFSFPGRY